MNVYTTKYCDNCEKVTIHMDGKCKRECYNNKEKEKNLEDLHTL